MNDVTNSRIDHVNSGTFPVTPPNYNDIVAIGGLQSSNIKASKIPMIVETELDKSPNFSDSDIITKY